MRKGRCTFNLDERFDTDGMLLASLDWLLDRRIFNGLSRDAAYCEARLGFNAPNAFLLDLIR